MLQPETWGLVQPISRVIFHPYICFMKLVPVWGNGMLLMGPSLPQWAQETLCCLGWGLAMEPEGDCLVPQCT